MKNHHWHLSLFAARLGLIAIVLIYLTALGGVAHGGFNFTGVLALISLYVVATLLVGFFSQGRELSPRLQRIQTLLDNAALVIGVPHDPSMAMPVLFYLAINPLEFGVRFGSGSYRFSVACAAIASVLILVTRAQFFPMGVSPEASGLLLFTWSAIIYGLITVYGMGHLRGDLQALNSRHQTAMRTVGFASWEWNRHGRAAGINPGVEALMGIAPGSYDGELTTFFDLIHDDDREPMQRELRRHVDAGESFELHFRRVLPSGRIRWLASRGEVQETDEKGNASHYAGVIWDITAEMLAMHESEAALERIDSASKIARVGFWRLDVATKNFEFDWHWRHITGMPMSGPISMEYILDHVHADDHEALATSFSERLEQGGQVDIGFGWWTPTREYLYVRVSGGERRDANGALIGFSGISEDQTEDHENEVELAALRQRYNTALHSANVSAWTLFVDEQNIETDDNLNNVLGITDAEFDGSLENLLQLVHADDRELVSAEFQHAIINRATSSVRYRRVLADKSVRWIQSRGEPILDKNGEVTHIGGASWDVTREVTAEQETQAALARIEEATRVSAVGFWELNLATMSLKFDTNWQSRVGIPASQAVTIPYLLEHMAAADIPAFTQHLETTSSQGGPVNLSFSWIRPEDGESMHLRVRGSARRAVDGTIIGVGGVAMDETDQHAAQAELKALRDLHDRSMRAARVGGWTWFVDKQLVDVETHVEALFGIPKGSYDGSLETWGKIIHPDDQENVTQALRHSAGTAEPFETTYRVSLGDGSTRWLATRGEPTDIGEDGHVITIAGATWDITAEMTARQATESALVKVEAAATAGKLGFWRQDAKTGSLELDENWRRVLGFDMHAALPSLEESLQWVYPQDRAAFVQAIQTALSKSEPLFHEYRVLRADTGALRYFQIRGDAVRDKKGKILFHAGFIMDQTEVVTLRNEAERTKRLLETALKSVHATAFTLSAEDRKIKFVGEVQRTVGLPDDTPIGDLPSVIKFVDQRDQACALDAINQSLNTGAALDFIYRVPHQLTDAVHWYQMRGRAVKNLEDEITGLIGVIVDETETIERRREIEALRQRYDRALKSAGIGGWTWYVAEDKFEVDTVLFELFEVKPEAFAGNFDAVINNIHPDDRAACKQEMQDSIDAGIGFEIRYRRQLRNGISLWTMTRGEPVKFSDKGAVIEVAGATWDVTELAQLTEALQRSNTELDDFAYVASHDLREPLRGLHNYAKFLQEDYADKVDDEGKRMLLSLGRLAQRLESLITDLLQFSRVGRTELAIENTDLTAVLNDVLQTLDFMIEEQQVEIRQIEPLGIVHCDRIRVGELFRNLITNAVKYNDKDEKWIEIGRKGEVFYIRDNGIGIPPEYHERIFGIFKRLHTRDAFGGGTGAGLTIVKRIIERHGGTIWLESEVGKGTTFYFILAERRAKPRD